eukprot:4273006-Pleurochrysis_carterae.AAC.1
MSRNRGASRRVSGPLVADGRLEPPPLAVFVVGRSCGHSVVSRAVVQEVFNRCVRIEQLQLAEGRAEGRADAAAEATAAAPFLWRVTSGRADVCLRCVANGRVGARVCGSSLASARLLEHAPHDKLEQVLGMSAALLAAADDDKDKDSKDGSGGKDDEDDEAHEAAEGESLAVRALEQARRSQSQPLAAPSVRLALCASH